MQTMTETLQKLIGKPLVESTDQEIYLALLDLVRSKSAAQVRPVNGRKLYYISAEFLIGKLLSNNLINLGLYDDVRDALAAAGKEENLARLQHELKTKDWFQTLPDFNAYVVRKGQALSDYACDPLGWRRKCLINISKAGFFSSDRTIAEYNSDIWHLGE